MKRLLLAALLELSTFGPPAYATTITVNQLDYPGVLDFTIEWGPVLQVDRTKDVSTHIDINNSNWFSVDARVVSGFWDFPPERPFITFSISLWATVYHQVGDYGVNFAFPAGAEPLLSLATLHGGGPGLLPTPTITPSPDGYGARFMFENLPPLDLTAPDSGSTAALLAAAVLPCLGLRSRFVSWR